MATVPKIKFCGMTRLEDAELAVELDAWAVGMVFHPGSPRCCPQDSAVEIGSALKRRCEVAGVFHNAKLDTVARIAENCSLTLVQLHGDEGPAYCEEVARKTGCEVIKAARVKSVADVLGLRVYRTAYHLLDTHRDGLPGGTGATFPWEFARRHAGPAPFILAGGLTPLNVGDAIAAADPWAVDVASGIEISPGIKGEVLMRDFADAVRMNGPDQSQAEQAA